MREIAPGVFHWTAIHPSHGMEVSSYYLADEAVLLDPMVPGDGLDFFDEHGPPAGIVLTNRHHYRGSADFVERFGCAVHCHRAGLHEFTHGEDVEPFEPGDEPVPGVVVKQVDAICPDEVAVYAPRPNAVALADGLVRWNPDDPLGFVPDGLMDDPPKTKQGLLDAFRALVSLEPRHLLLAHGNPIVGNGADALREFVDHH
jgi:hypothetical protein